MKKKAMLWNFQENVVKTLKGDAKRKDVKRKVVRPKVNEWKNVGLRTEAGPR